MLKKISNSFAFRSAFLYKGLLKFVPFHITSKPRNIELKMVTLCGIKHLPFLKRSLVSIIKNFNEVPLIEIYSDGSMSLNELKKSLRKFSSLITVKEWEECTLTDTINEQRLTSFAKKHPIGKKLLIILKNSKEVPTLWWDTDILWFKDYSGLNLPRDKKILTLITTEDYQPAYSKNMLHFFPNHQQKPYINTGIVYLNEDLISKVNVDNLIEIASEKPDHFSEQTIIAKATFLMGKKTWPLDMVSCTQSDQLTLKPTFLGKTWIARHYVGPVRHLFWRDSFFQSLGNK